MLLVLVLTFSISKPIQMLFALQVIRSYVLERFKILAYLLVLLVILNNHIFINIDFFRIKHLKIRYLLKRTDNDISLMRIFKDCVHLSQVPQTTLSHKLMWAQCL
jgi:hypothetical protein